MATKSGKTADKSQGRREAAEKREKATPRSLEIARAGIKTSLDFRLMMTSLMSDLIVGAVTPTVGNAVCNTGGKLLKMVELEYKFGTRPDARLGSRTLTLGIEEPSKPQQIPNAAVGR